MLKVSNVPDQHTKYERKDIKILFCNNSIIHGWNYIKIAHQEVLDDYFVSGLLE